MILHCREFDIDGNSVILGHDRETGKRYLCIEATPEFLQNPRDKMTEISRIEWEQICSIFWIDEKREVKYGRN